MMPNPSALSGSENVPDQVLPDVLDLDTPTETRLTLVAGILLALGVVFLVFTMASRQTIVAGKTIFPSLGAAFGVSLSLLALGTGTVWYRKNLREYYRIDKSGRRLVFVQEFAGQVSERGALDAQKIACFTLEGSYRAPSGSVSGPPSGWFYRVVAVTRQGRVVGLSQEVKQRDPLCALARGLADVLGVAYHQSEPEKTLQVDRNVLGDVEIQSKSSWYPDHNVLAGAVLLAIGAIFLAGALSPSLVKPVGLIAAIVVGGLVMWGSGTR